MEIRKNVRNTITNTEGKQFTINASAKAFRILSDGLYSDKITAIIRELSTNAYDAHVAAGNADQPFHVHLPKTYPEDESYFSIRDFGNSMTHDQVMELYTTYFGSDKTGSNEFIGALGLGSKSPFSYTDSFSVTAYLDGEKRSYVAFMDKSGTPTISLLSQDNTSDPDGVEIKFNVLEQSIDDFVNKSRNVYRFFPVKPVVTGNVHYSHYDDKSYIESDTWQLVSSNKWHAKCYAIQGNIAYQIDPIHFDDEKSSFIARNAFHVQFDIGDLDVSASRESLSYDKETIENINRRFTEVYDSFISKINDIVALEKSEWHAKVKAHEILNNLNDLRNVKLSYNGSDLGNLSHYNVDFEKFPSVNVIQYWRLPSYRSDYIKRAEVSKRSDRYGVNKGYHFPVNADALFVEDDGSKLKIPRVRHFADMNPGKNVFLVEGATRKFWSFVGKPAKIKLAKLETPPRKKRADATGGKFYFPWNNGISLEGGITLDDLPKGEKFYVEIKSNNLIKNGHKISFSSIVKDIQMAIELGLIDADARIFGVMGREIKTKRFTKLGMIELFGYLHSQVVDKVSEMKDDLDEHFKAQIKLNSLNNMSRLSRGLLQHSEITEMVNPNSRVFEIQTQILSIKNDWKNRDVENNEINMLIEMAQKHRVEIVRPDFNFQIDSLEAYYPMLGMINHYSYDFDKIVDYINMVDASKEQ